METTATAKAVIYKINANIYAKLFMNTQTNSLEWKLTLEQPESNYIKLATMRQADSIALTEIATKHLLDQVTAAKESIDLLKSKMEFHTKYDIEQISFDTIMDLFNKWMEFSKVSEEEMDFFQ